MRLFPGDKAPVSGIYKVIGLKGKVINTLKVNEGDLMPPTQNPDFHFEIN